MKQPSILIVDDERNIRLTMSHALQPLGMPIETAVNGEEALRKIEGEPFLLMFLDLKMPGMDGLEVLRRVRESRPNLRVVMITAHGTVENAVEALKLGSVDFVQKPFTPDEIRGIARQVLNREAIEEVKTDDADSWIALTKRHITDRNYAEAKQTVRKAIAVDPGCAEAYNLLGVLQEIAGESIEAQKFYRAAIEIDPTYSPARTNLERITSWKKFGSIDLGDDGQKSITGNPKNRKEQHET